MENKIKIKKLHEYGRINTPAFIGDAGFDVYATKSISLHPLERVAMPLGIAIEFQSDLVCQVNTKSGLAIKQGFDTIGNIIDSNYRGEIHAIIVNTTNTDIFITAGTKVAQLVFLHYSTPEIEYVEELTVSERNENKFGSTGVK